MTALQHHWWQRTRSTWCLTAGLSTLQNWALAKAEVLQKKKGTWWFDWRDQYTPGVNSSDDFSPCKTTVWKHQCFVHMAALCAQPLPLAGSLSLLLLHALGIRSEGTDLKRNAGNLQPMHGLLQLFVSSEGGYCWYTVLVLNVTYNKAPYLFELCYTCKVFKLM